MRRDAPAACCGKGFLAGAETMQQSRNTGAPGAQRQSAGGGQVELARVAAHLADNGDQTAAGEALLQGPQKIVRPPAGNRDDAAGIEAEPDQPGAADPAHLAGACRIAHPQDETVPAPRQTGQKGGEETGRFAGGTHLVHANFMQIVASEPAAGEHPVDRRHLEGQHRSGAIHILARGRGGRPAGEGRAADLPPRSVGVVIEPDRGKGTPLDLGDPPTERANVP